MTSRISRRVAAVAWTLAIGLAQRAPVHAQATTTRIVTVSPWTRLLDPKDPATPEFACLPEPIFLQGEIRSQVTRTTDAMGRVHLIHQLIPNNVEGFGLVSGAFYRAVGTHQHAGSERDIILPLNPPPIQLFLKQVFIVIGQGQATDFMLLLNLHVTVNANGEVQAVVDQFRVTCQ